MNKLGLRKIVHKECSKKLPSKYTKEEVAGLLDVVLDTMMDALLTTKRLSLRDIGVFEIIHSRDKQGWDPFRQKAMIVKGSARIKFTPATKIDKIINPHRFNKQR